MQRMRRRKREEAPHDQPPSGGQPAENPETGGSVQVIWGAMAETLDLGEFTVGEAFRMLRAPFNIAPAVNALVNGRPVDAETRLCGGDVLEFARPAGEKGNG